MVVVLQSSNHITPGQIKALIESFQYRQLLILCIHYTLNDINKFVYDIWQPCGYRTKGHLLLVDPVVLSGLPRLNLTLLEPKSDLLLGVLDAVGTVADVASNINCVVLSYGLVFTSSAMRTMEKWFKL